MKNKRNMIVGLAALLTAAGVWLALFGLPTNRLDYAAFAHNYDYDGDTDTDFHVELDKVQDGNTFCNPVDASAAVAIGSTEQVAVCVTDYPVQAEPPDTGIGVFAFDLVYDSDLNQCNDVANVAPAVDDNPDANAGTTVWPAVGTGDNLGGGWDCSGFGLAYPTCDSGDPSLVLPAKSAKIGCGSLTGPYDLGDDEDTGVLGVVTFDVLAGGIDNLSLANVVVGDQTAAEVGSCNPGIGVPIPCEGAVDLKADPPDMEVTKTCDDQVLVGAAISCDIHVENIGLGDALAVSLLAGEVGGPSINYTGYSILPSDPGCVFVAGLGGGLACPLGLVAAGASFDITMNATAAGPEGFNVNGASATVTLGLPDGDAANNADSAVIHEFLPDINVNKLDVSDGLPGVPADGWTMDLYAGACPPAGGAIDTGVTAGGTVSFPDLAVGTYCVEETLIDPSQWSRADCTTGDPIVGDLDEEVVLDGTAKAVDVDICNTLLSVPTKMVKDPDLANLWLCDAPWPACAAEGAGHLTIDEFVDLGSPKDPEGVGAFEVQIKFDHKIFDIVAEATGWLYSTGRIPGPLGIGGCAMTIVNENSILLGCVSKDNPATPEIDLGVNVDGVAATLAVTPESDLRYRLTPGQNNGVVRTILDENCELADIFGDPLSKGVDELGRPILLPGIVTGGLVAVCGDATITVRILEGDLNLDCTVDVTDDQAIAYRYGAFFGNLLYDPWYDLEPALKDFDVDIKDLQKVFGRNGSTCLSPIPSYQTPQLPPP